MMTILRQAACCLAISTFAGCSSPSAGGGGFEGEALSLSGSARTSEAPLAGAGVSFIDVRSELVLGRTKTDSAGAFRMPLPSGAVGYVEVSSGDTALCRQFVELASDASLSLESSRPVPWNARSLLGGMPAAGAQIRILGSDRSAKTDALGRFTLARSSQDREWAEVALADGTHRELRLPPLADTLLPLENDPSILLDDFEGGDTRSALGHAIGSGDWFALTDIVNGGTSTALPAGVVSNIQLAYSTAQAYAGTSIDIQFQVDPSQYFHYAQLIVSLSDTGWWTDLSKLDSVVFMAKGSGSMRLEFANRLSLEPTSDPAGRFGVDFQIPSNWTRHMAP